MPRIELQNYVIEEDTVNNTFDIISSGSVIATINSNGDIIDKNGNTVYDATNGFVPLSSIEQDNNEEALLYYGY